MAKINIELDSTENTLVVSVNGTKVDRVSMVEIYAYDGDGGGYDGDGDERVSCTITTSDTDSDMRTCTRMSTSECAIARQEGVRNSKRYPGMIELVSKSNGKLFKDVYEYLTNSR